MSEVCALVLAAGFGTRLRPLTEEKPKALVPVGNVPLLERALLRLADAGLTGPDVVAVNAHHHADQVIAHVGDRATLSLEEPEPLGSAGALGLLRDWIGGRHVMVLNADAYVSAPPGDLLRLLDGWDGRTVRMIGHKADDGHPPFGGLAFAGASLIPAHEVEPLKPVMSHLVLTTWGPAERAGRLEVIELDGGYLDCGTPEDYLAANLHASQGENVIGAGAVVEGEIERCVLWPGARVAPGERLRDAIRTTSGLTVQVTRP